MKLRNLSYFALLILVLGMVSAFNYTSQNLEDESGIVLYSSSIKGFLDDVDEQYVTGFFLYDSSTSLEIAEDFAAVFSLSLTQVVSNSFNSDFRIVAGVVNSSLINSDLSSFLMETEYDGVVLYQETNFSELLVVAKSEDVLPIMLDNLKFYHGVDAFIEDIAFYSIEKKFTTTSNYIECDTPETDFGFDPNAKGCFNDSFFGEICDFCDSSSELIETSCEGGIALFYRHECETGCVSGSGRCDGDCIDGSYTNIYKCSNENGAAVGDYGKKVVQRKMRGEGSNGECMYQWAEPDVRTHVFDSSLGSSDGECLYGCQNGACLPSGSCQEGKIFGSDSCSNGFLNWLNGSYSESGGCQVEQKFESCRLGCQDVDGVDRCLAIEDTCPEEVVGYSCLSDGRTLKSTEQYIQGGECRTRTNRTDVVCQFGCVSDGDDARCLGAPENEYRCEGSRLMKKERFCATCDWKTLEVCGFGCDERSGVCLKRTCGPTMYCILPEPACEKGEYCWGARVNYSDYLVSIAGRVDITSSTPVVLVSVVPTPVIPDPVVVPELVVEPEPEVNEDNCKEKWSDVFECDRRYLQQMHTFIKSEWSSVDGDYDLSCVSEFENVKRLGSARSCNNVLGRPKSLAKYDKELGCPDFWWGSYKRYFADFKCEGRVLYQKFSGGESCSDAEGWERVKSFWRAKSCANALNKPATLAKYDRPVGCPKIWKSDFKCEGRILYQNYTGGAECSVGGQWFKVKTLKNSKSCGNALAKNPVRYGRGLSKKNKETYTRWAGMMGFAVADFDGEGEGRMPDWRDDIHDWWYNLVTAE